MTPNQKIPDFEEHNAYPKEKTIKADNDIELDNKIENLAKLIKNAKHAVFLTGAGISTSAGIPDYRGPEGVWTKKIKGENACLPVDKILCATPTKAHMSIFRLIEKGFAKYVITQNVDGLHRKSGLKLFDRLTELHGCTFVEKCRSCKRFFERQYRTRSKANHSSHHHQTSNLCEMCGGICVDTIVTFGEQCDSDIWNMSETQAMVADLFIVVGSSLTLQHINQFPQYSLENGGHFVLINMMPTPLDCYANIKISANIDDVFVKLMTKLSLDIPEPSKNWYPQNALPIIPFYVKNAQKRIRKTPKRTIECDTGDVDSGSEDEDRCDNFKVENVFEGSSWPTGQDHTSEWRIGCAERFRMSYVNKYYQN